MERLVNEALSGAIGLSWTRILFHSQSGFERQAIGTSTFAVHAVPLTRGKETLGQVLFARGADHQFSRDETGFLSQIADAVSLAIDRLTKLEQSETLKTQWEATFDAILEPVSVIDENFNVVRANHAFAKEAGRIFHSPSESGQSRTQGDLLSTDPNKSPAESEKIIGKKCYQMVFGRETPCDGCALGTSYRLKPARTTAGTNTIYEVFSQPIQFTHDDRPHFVNMYHDVSEKLRYERQILESAKMAELGTIGSSIAHELNNPLGGMLSFLQLIKMDLKGNEPWAEDIDEMERGARRCRDIVQSLLGFTRKSRSDVVEVFDLRETVEQALKITELQTRAMGITVVREFSDENDIADKQGLTHHGQTKHDPPAPHLREGGPIQAYHIRGQFNFVAQALRNFLQNAQEAIADRAKRDKSLQGQIRVRIVSDANERVVEIIDNGTGFDTKISEMIYDPMYTAKDPVQNPGLGIPVAQKIITDHGGRLEIESTREKGTKVKIRFPRPD
jgi:signal transduction histidine kinase